MSDEIKVYVVNKGRTNLYLRYTDPMTNKYVEKSAGTSNYNAALRAAGVWQDELQSGRYQKPSRISWADFRLEYTTHVLSAVAKSTAVTYDATFNTFERHCNPQKLSDVTTARVTAFVTKLRNEGRAEATIACHLRGLRAAMRWAHKQDKLLRLPEFSMPKRVKGAKAMKGRPITAEEFDRMLEAIPKVVENVASDSWEFYLRGLWESGLRLSESLVLRWDDAPDAIVVDLGRRRPMFRIAAEAEKGRQDRLLPMTPEFASLLQEVPARQRHGRVFKLLGVDGKPMSSSRRRLVGPIVSAIGKSAGVVVDERLKLIVNDEGEKVRTRVRKFASAHDLRRSFGQRWSLRVLPTVLQQLMRHEDIGTTMRFYVGQDADALADAVWAASIMPASSAAEPTT